MNRRIAFVPLLLLAPLLSNCTAHADSPDDGFLQAMQDKGLAQFFSSSDDQIGEAHRVCTDLRNGSTANSIAFVIGRDHHLNDLGLESSFLNTSIDFYCPDVPHPQL